jgi:hypothetical protein
MTGEGSLENLWMALSGIAALEEDRRLMGEDEGVSDGADDE